MEFEVFDDGIVICGDCTNQEVINKVVEHTGHVGLIIADPPYGNVVDEKWDRVIVSAEEFASWMCKWTEQWADSALLNGGAFYVWGGIGSVGFRPFMRYMCNVEMSGKFELSNLITWKKRRAYGVKNNYLFTREECAYFVKGLAKKPLKFNIPLLAEKRGYMGYNKKYPAKSEYYRRTNVWTDITEIMRGKKHPTEKAQKLHEIMIEVHTDQGDWVIDPFAGSGVTAFAARKLGRKFAIVEFDKAYYEVLVKRLKGIPLE